MFGLKRFCFCYCTIHLIVLYNCEEYLIKPKKHLILLRHEFHTVYCLYVFIIKTYIYDHLYCFLPNICSHYSFNFFSNCFKEMKNICWRKTCSVWKVLFFQIMRPLTWTNFGFWFIHRPIVYCRGQFFFLLSFHRLYHMQCHFANRLITIKGFKITAVLMVQNKSFSGCYCW